MKKLTYLLIGGLSMFLFKPAKAQVPNNGFEKWDTVNTMDLEIINPEGWLSNNAFWQTTYQTSAILPINNSYAGSHAVKMIAVKDTSENPDPVWMMSFVGDIQTGNASNKFPVLSTPQNLMFWYQVKANEKQLFQASITLFKMGNVLHHQDYFIEDKTEQWKPFIVPINYTENEISDSASIVFYFAIDDQIEWGSEFWIDEIELSYATTGIADSKSARSLSVYPNPARNSIHLNLEQDAKLPAKVSVVNVLGQPIIEGNIESPASASILVDQLQAGTYFVQLVDQTGKTWTGKVIKE